MIPLITYSLLFLFHLFFTITSYFLAIITLSYPNHHSIHLSLSWSLFFTITLHLNHHSTQFPIIVSRLHYQIAFPSLSLLLSLLHFHYHTLIFHYYITPQSRSDSIFHCYNLPSLSDYTSLIIIIPPFSLSYPSVAHNLTISHHSHYHPLYPSSSPQHVLTAGHFTLSDRGGGKE